MNVGSSVRYGDPFGALGGDPHHPGFGRADPRCGLWAASGALASFILGAEPGTKPAALFL